MKNCGGGDLPIFYSNNHYTASEDLSLEGLGIYTFVE